MTFLRGTVKMDIPDYIVSEVDDRLSDGATPQTSQDATTAAAQTVAQYSSEYEILTESEIEEKYQADPDNAEIAIEMSKNCRNLINSYTYIYSQFTFSSSFAGHGDSCSDYNNCPGGARGCGQQCGDDGGWWHNCRFGDAS